MWKPLSFRSRLVRTTFQVSIALRLGRYFFFIGFMDFTYANEQDDDAWLRLSCVTRNVVSFLMMPREAQSRSSAQMASSTSELNPDGARAFGDKGSVSTGGGRDEDGTPSETELVATTERMLRPPAVAFTSDGAKADVTEFEIDASPSATHSSQRKQPSSSRTAGRSHSSQRERVESAIIRHSQI
jgi:hypothetical protein